MLDNRKVLINPDKVNMADQEDVATATVNLFDRIQTLPGHIQLLALAAAFVLIIDASGYNAQDAFTATKNLMHSPSTMTRKGLKFQAMEYNIRENLNGR